MKPWVIQAGANQYEICIKGQKVLINGQAYPLKNITKVRKAAIFYEYHLPIEGAEVLMVTGIWAPELVVDGRYVASGKEYVALSKVPGWSYIFLVLHAINLINGAIGGALAVVGAFATMRVSCEQRLPTAMRVVISILILAACYIAVFVIAFILALLFYR